MLSPIDEPPMRAFARSVKFGRCSSPDAYPASARGVMLTPGAPPLLHVVGYLTGTVLYAMLLAMVVRAQGRAIA